MMLHTTTTIFWENYPRVDDLPPVVKKDQSLPLFSVVTPSYNQGQFIRETIESVLTQDYPNIEYWVIDGNSTDKTVSILGEYEHDPRFHWISEKDHGQSDAINKGLARCRGEIFSWLNSDDLLVPGALGHVAGVWSAQPPAIIYGRAKFIDPCGNDLGYCAMQSSRMDLGRLFSGKYSPVQPASFVPTEYARRIGGIDTQLHYSMDFDFLVRLAEMLSFKSIAYDLALYRLHKTSKTIALAEGFISDIEQVYHKAVTRGTVSERQAIVLANLLAARKYLMPEINDRSRAMARLRAAARVDYSVIPEAALILLKAGIRSIVGDRLWSKVRLVQSKLG